MAALVDDGDTKTLPLPPGFTTANKKNPFFLGRFDGFRSLVKRDGNMLLPGVHSLYRKVFDFQQLYRDGMNKEAPVDIQPDGSVGPSGIHSSFDRCCTVSGYTMNPLSYVLRNNELLRSEMGLVNKWRSARHRDIFRATARHLLQTWKVSAPKLANRSKSGMPYMEYTAGEKLTRLYSMMEDGRKRVHRAFRMVGKHDLEGLRKDYGIVLGYILNTRGQVDYIGKDRWVNPFDFAMSGGKQGERMKADKTVFANGRAEPQMCAMRARIIQAFSNLPGTLMQIAANGHMQYMFVDMQSMTHHSDMDELCEEVNKKHGRADHSLYAGDVSDFDSTVPVFFDDEFYAILSEFYCDEFVELVKLSDRAPYFAPPLSKDGDPLWMGNPDDVSTFDVIGGIRSGSPWVSFKGKLFKIVEELCLADDFFHDVIERHDEYLHNQTVITIKNAGDDNQTYGPVEFIDWLEMARLKKDDNGVYEYGYFKVEKEKGAGFIGSIFYRDPDYQWHWMRKIHSAFEKQWCPEHGITSTHRKFYPFGWYQRKVIYGSHPQASLSNDMELHAWEESGCRHEFGNMNVIIDAAADMVGRPELYAESLADMEVLMSPDKLHYKFRDGTISERVLDLLVRRVDLDVCVNYMQDIYGGDFFDPITIQ